MTRTFYWSDTHFDHDLPSRQRGFATASEHDDHLINGWLSKVGKKDSVWLLGDLASSNPARSLEILSHLPGRKHLVLGNHDPAHPMHRGSHRMQSRYRAVFDSVNLAELRRIGDRQVLLSHFPYEPDARHGDRYAQWQPKDQGLWLLHGHVHQEWTVRGRQINVGVDSWLDGPVEEKELAAMMDAAEQAAA